MPAYGVHWLPTNNVYFVPPSNTVVVVEDWKSLIYVVMSRRCCFQRLKSTLYAIQKGEDSRWNWFGKTDAIVIVTVCVTFHCIELRKPPELKFKCGNGNFISETSHLTGPSDQSEHSRLVERKRFRGTKSSNQIFQTNLPFKIA